MKFYIALYEEQDCPDDLTETQSVLRHQFSVEAPTLKKAKVVGKRVAAYIQNAWGNCCEVTVISLKKFIENIETHGEYLVRRAAEDQTQE